MCIITITNYVPKETMEIGDWTFNGVIISSKSGHWPEMVNLGSREGRASAVDTASCLSHQEGRRHINPPWRE